MKTPLQLLDEPKLPWYPETIQYNARVYGNKPAVICGGDRLTWSQFHLQTNKVANALHARGIGRGGRVCLLMKNSISLFELLWGTIKAGGVVVPLNVMMASSALPAMINNSGARLLFADADSIRLVDLIKDQLENVNSDGLFAVDGAKPGWQSARRIVDAAPDTDADRRIDPSDSMNIIYSSGSTGVPKGIEHTHFARLAYTIAFGSALVINRFAITLCATPLYTNGTWLAMLPTVYSGGTVVLLTKFSAGSFLEAIEREKCTHTFLVPTQAVTILAAPDLRRYDVSPMKVLMLGSQMLTTTTAAQLRESFPSAGLYQVYGMTEASLTLAIPGDVVLGKEGTVGLPLFGADVRVITNDGKEAPCGEVGEIVGATVVSMKGYYNDVQRTAEIIWNDATGRRYLRTGDMGRMDEDGYLYIVGRKRDIIKSGGINVFASDLEEVFSRHPDVLEAAAIAVPHKKWGETPLLLAIMRPGAVTSETELMQWGNERLGKYQRVSGVEFRNEFPRTANNKVLKRVLRDPYWTEEGAGARAQESYVSRALEDLHDDAEQTKRSGTHAPRW